MTPGGVSIFWHAAHYAAGRIRDATEGVLAAARRVEDDHDDMLERDRLALAVTVLERAVAQLRGAVTRWAGPLRDIPFVEDEADQEDEEWPPPSGQSP